MFYPFVIKAKYATSLASKDVLGRLKDNLCDKPSFVGSFFANDRGGFCGHVENDSFLLMRMRRRQKAFVPVLGEGYVQNDGNGSILYLTIRLSYVVYIMILLMIGFLINAIAVNDVSPQVTNLGLCFLVGTSTIIVAFSSESKRIKNFIKNIIQV